MRYLHHSLLDNEQIIYTSRPHWNIFVPACSYLLIALVLLLSQPYVLAFSVHISRFTVAELLAMIFGTYGSFLFIKQYVIYRCSEYGVTNKRVLMKTGLFERNSLEIFLDKIEAVHIDQTIWGRIWGYGSLIIIGTGGSKDPFENIPHPLHFRRMIQQEIDYVEEHYHRA